MSPTVEHEAVYSGMLAHAWTVAMEQHMSVPQQEHPASGVPPDRLATLEQFITCSGTLCALRHTINNALTNLYGNLQFLQRETLSPTARELAATMLTASEQLTALLQTTLLLSGTASDEQHCDVDHLLHAVLTVVNPLARERGIRIVTHAPPALRLAVSLTDAQQVVLHLLLNSIQAMQHDYLPHTIWLHAVAWNSNVVLTVRDDGPGIADTLRPYVFEPFVSTKPAPQGTGLGLTIARSILRRTGGDIALTDARPRHTTFTVWFPRHTGEPQTETMTS